MARTVSIGFAAAADAVKWTVDADCTLVGAVSTKSTCFLSRNPAGTFANMQTASATGIVDTTIIGAQSVGNINRFPSVQLYQGESVYFSTSGSGYLILYLEP